METEKNLPLEELRQLIDEEMIDEEIPFDILADEYPSLLKDWYPGYPGTPREMTDEDPYCMVGELKDGVITFVEQPDLKIPFEPEGDTPEEGEYMVWIRSVNDMWDVVVIPMEDEHCGDCCC